MGIHKGSLDRGLGVAKSGQLWTAVGGSKLVKNG